MALLDIRFRSSTLQQATAVTVLLPEEREPGFQWPVLLLLHGLSDDHTTWMRMTAIERYVRKLRLCVVMPSANRSFYTDMVHGNRYYSYISAELPRILHDMFPLSRRREDHFVAGLSMGGYGAFKLALNNPDQFSAAASMSGVLDMAHYFRSVSEKGPREDIKRLAEDIFGSAESFVNSTSDLRRMAEFAAIRGNCPRLFMCCGTEDHLYDNNLRYLSLLQSLGLPVTYEEDPGYAHTWDYWDLKIQRVLEWLQEA
ncbi:MAG: alpha/beta hydrolase, partial [Christensenellales bacterium]|jgi:putative tributyrin esterase